MWQAPPVVFLTYSLALLAALACSSGPKSATCAGGSEATYREQAELFSWPVYCPTFMPRGAFVARADFGLTPTGGLSTVTFGFAEGETIQVIQGRILISPRSGRGFARPVQDVSFGDVLAQLFITSDGPLVRQVQVTAEDLTRAVRGSAGLDPDTVVKVAEKMRRVEE